MKLFAEKRRGFTLIEMTIVLFIISLLVLIIIPNMSHARKSADDTHTKAMVSVVQSQIDTYLDDYPELSKDQVELKTLGDKHYLTEDQITKAGKEHIKIDKSNHAVINDSQVDNPDVDKTNSK